MNRNSRTSDVAALDEHGGGGDDEDNDDEDEVVELVPCDDCGHLVPPANMEMHRLRGCPNRKHRPDSPQRRRRRQQSNSNNDGVGETSSPRSVNVERRQHSSGRDGTTSTSRSRGWRGDDTSDQLRQSSWSAPAEEPLGLDLDVSRDGARDPPQNPGFVEPQPPQRGSLDVGSRAGSRNAWTTTTTTARLPVVQGRNVRNEEWAGSTTSLSVASPANGSPTSPWDRLTSTISSAVCGVPTATEINVDDDDNDDQPPRSDARDRGSSRHRYPASRRNRHRLKSPPPSQPQAEVIDVLDSPPQVAAAAAAVATSARAPARASSRHDGPTFMDTSIMDSDMDDLPANEDDGWACPRCTLQNPRSQAMCEACMYLLPRQQRHGAVRPPDSTRTETLLPPGPPILFGSAYDDADRVARGRRSPSSSQSSPSALRSSYVGTGAILGGVLGAASSYVRGRPVARGALDGAMGGAMGGLAVDAVVQQQQQYERQYQQQRQSELDMALARQQSRRRREQEQSRFLQPPDRFQPQQPRTGHYAGGTDTNGTSRTYRMGNGSFTVRVGRSSTMNPLMLDMLLQQSMMANMMGHGGLGGGQAQWVTANGGAMGSGGGGGGGGGMNYEQLLQMFGDGTENLGADEQQISALPTSTVTSKDHKKGQCSICLQDFGVGDSFKTLPCLHCDFHTSCIDQWLKTNAVCPVCKHRLE